MGGSKFQEFQFIPTTLTEDELSKFATEMYMYWKRRPVTGLAQSITSRLKSGRRISIGPLTAGLKKQPQDFSLEVID